MVQNSADLYGKSFGKLTVLPMSFKSLKGLWYYICKCQCGNLSVVRRDNLLTSHSESCGCCARNRGACRVDPKVVYKYIT